LKESVCEELLPRDDIEVFETAEYDSFEPALLDRFGELLDSLSTGFSAPLPADTPHVVGRGGRFDLKVIKRDKGSINK
jgi:hypothetical protein